jgi:flagellar secretion chaperone FliS
MPVTAQDAYLESRVLTADPLELVRMVYRAAVEATRRARAHLAGGRIAERSREICRALALISELSGSLDHTRGGALSAGLAQLYDYLQRRLLEANAHQKAEPLAEVERLLVTLLAGWERIRPASETQPIPVRKPDAAPCRPDRPSAYGAYSPIPQLVPDAALEYAAQSWSF